MKVLDSTDGKVIHIIYQQMKPYVSQSEVTPEKSLVNDLGVDSLDSVEIVMAMEETFLIEIPDEDAEKIVKVKDAIEYVKKKKA